MSLAILFYITAVITVACALFVVLNRNPVYSAVTLVLCFFSLAMLYLLLEAYFLAVLEIIVYAGAIMVLFLFVIMLLNVGKETALPVIKKIGNFISIFLVLIFSISITTILVINHTGLHQSTDNSEIGDVETIGYALFTKYLLPFEIASLLLLVALIGTVYLAKKRTT